MRRIIKLLIPNNGDVFFKFFIDAARYSAESASIIIKILNTSDKFYESELSSTLRLQQQWAIDNNKQVLLELSNQFITPIDRVDIQTMSMLFMKLTRRVAKINQKLKIYSIDDKTDDCLLRSAITLKTISDVLVDMMIALQANDYEKCTVYSQKIDTLDDNVIEDLHHTTKEMYTADNDIITLLKLKEMYKSFENAIETSTNISELVMQISIKDNR